MTASYVILMIIVKNIRDIIKQWPICFIQDDALEMLLTGKTDNARHSLVKRILKEGLLIRIRRGLYLISDRTVPLFIETFELQSLIYGSSFVSLESALSYHSWIPEGVYTTTCVSIKRAKEFKPTIGIFSYKRIPKKNFYTGVTRIKTKKGSFFIATPWRTLADFIYTRRKSWKNLYELEADLRIDKSTLINSDKKKLKTLSENYPSHRVRKILKKFLKEITKTLKV